MNSLPPDVLSHIGGFLQLWDMRSLRATSPALTKLKADWPNVFCTTFPSDILMAILTRILEFQPSNHACVAFWPRMSNLETLDLSEYDNPITDENMSALKQLPRLKCLDVSFHKITKLEPLGSLPKLQKLILRECNTIPGGEFCWLGDLPCLRVLNLSYCSITSGGLGYIRSLRLKLLDISHCPGIVDLVNLGEQPHLLVLRASSCINLVDKALRWVADSHIQILDISECGRITDVGLGHLGGASELANLKMAGCRDITNAGIRHLGALNKLYHLDLRGCDNLTAEIAEWLAQRRMRVAAMGLNGSR